MNIVFNLIEQFTDPWVLFGFLAQFVFFLRFVVQWLASEKEKKSIIPVGFWYLSIAGSLMILAYSIKRGDVVFIVGSIFNTMIYLRNIVLIHNGAKRQEKTPL